MRPIPALGKFFCQAQAINVNGVLQNKLKKKRSLPQTISSPKIIIGVLKEGREENARSSAISAYATFQYTGLGVVPKMS